MFVFVLNDTVTAESSVLPGTARRLDTGEWVGDLRSADAATQEACGWFEITTTPQPDDTASTTFQRTVEIVEGAPTEVWTEVNKSQERLDREAAAAEAVAAKAVQDWVVKDTAASRIRADEFDDTMVETLSHLYDPWVEGEAVEVGDLRRWSQTVVECLQAHTTQADWTPDAVPALWKIHRAAGSVTAWLQPAGAHDAYAIGDRVTHNGQTWESTADANIWEPGVFGWTVV